MSTYSKISRWFALFVALVMTMFALPTTAFALQPPPTVLPLAQLDPPSPPLSTPEPVLNLNTSLESTIQDDGYSLCFVIPEEEEDVPEPELDEPTPKPIIADTYKVTPIPSHHLTADMMQAYFFLDTNTTLLALPSPNGDCTFGFVIEENNNRIICLKTVENDITSNIPLFHYDVYCELVKMYNTLSKID